MTTQGKDNYSNRRSGNRGERFFALTFFRFVLIFGGALVALPIAAVLLLHSPWVQDQIIQYVVERIERDADVKVQFEKFHWCPFFSNRVNKSQRSAFGRGAVSLCAKRSELSTVSAAPLFSSAHCPTAKAGSKSGEGQRREMETPGGQAAMEQKSPGPTLPLSLQLPLTSVQVESGSIVVRQEGRHDPVVNVQNLNGELLFLLKSVLGAPNIKVDLQTLNGEVQHPNLGSFSACRLSALAISRAFSGSFRSTTCRENPFDCPGDTGFSSAAGEQPGHLAGTV